MTDGSELADVGMSFVKTFSRSGFFSSDCKNSFLNINDEFKLYELILCKTQLLFRAYKKIGFYFWSKLDNIVS